MKVLIVVARQYNGHELWTSLGTLQERSHGFEVLSTQTIIEDEVTHQKNYIERTLDDIDESYVDDFDGMLIVSGNMKDTEAYWKDSKVLGLIDRAWQADKPVGAICCSVPTIRNIAEGKRVSPYPLIRSKELLRNAGAILDGRSLSVDGKLVTAENQMLTQMWAEAFCDILEGKEHTVTLVESGFRPKGRTMRNDPTLQKWIDSHQSS